MPFITEEIWQDIKTKEDTYLIVSEWPVKKDYQDGHLNDAQLLFDLTGEIRNIRNQKGLSPKDALELNIKTNSAGKFDKIKHSLQKMANLSDISVVASKPENCLSFVYQSDEFYLPVTETIDIESEKKKLEEELKYTEGFLNSVNKKLSNQKFVEGAPAKVVEMERKKKEDAEAKIKAIKASLSTLS